MYPFRITLPSPRDSKRWSSTGTRLAAAFPVLLLAFSPLPLAAQGGKKPGGGGDGVTVNPVVPLVSAPIGYQRVELRWDATIPEDDPDGNGGEREDQQPGYGGILFNGINSQGVVVGSVGRPLAGYPDPYRTGVINVDPMTGELGASMFELDQHFALALEAINADLAPGAPEWRIAYARSVTASGLVSCYLLPNDMAKADYGSADVPLLAAVGDLMTRALTLLTPDDTGSTQWLVQLTESGHALLQTSDGKRLFRRAQDGTYDEVTLPTEVRTGLTAAGTSSGNNVSINDALELCFHEYVPVGTGTEARIVRYGAPHTQVALKSSIVKPSRFPFPKPVLLRRPQKANSFQFEAVTRKPSPPAEGDQNEHRN
jgi:hypothetical protein